MTFTDDILWSLILTWDEKISQVSNHNLYINNFYFLQQNNFHKA